MKNRIKVVGYIDLDSLEADQIDLADSSGLSELGHRQLLSSAEGSALSVLDLEDVETSISIDFRQ